MLKSSCKPTHLPHAVQENWPLSHLLPRFFFLFHSEELRLHTRRWLDPWLKIPIVNLCRKKMRHFCSSHAEWTEPPETPPPPVWNQSSLSVQRCCLWKAPKRNAKGWIDAGCGLASSRLKIRKAFASVCSAHDGTLFCNCSTVFCRFSEPLPL